MDDIRNLTDQVRIPPQTGKYKVYIIDEVHMLSTNAFNAFLKTLEEPPAHAIFILATTEKHKIIPTILSRCQIFDFKRIGVLDAKNYLKVICEKEQITADDDALHIIAQKADGAMRDALSIFDRVVSFSGDTLTREAVTQNLNVLDYEVYFDMTDLLLANKIPEVLIAFNTILSNGFEGHHFINGLASHFRDILVAKDTATVNLLEVGDNAKKRYLEQAVKASIPFLIQSIEKANDCDLKYRTSKNQRLLVELTLMQIASITFDGEKKKPANYIIPATFFTSLSPAKTTQKPIVSAKDKEAIVSEPKTAAVKEPVATPVLKNIKRRTSSLSLKSIHIKKEEGTVQSTEENFDKHPRDNFSQADLEKAWKEYYGKLIEKGQKNIAAILIADSPKLNNGVVVQLTLPNQLMANQLEREKQKLTKFLREALNNYALQTQLIVNEAAVKKFAYTPQEKYEKLLEKNPLLASLKNAFKLDV